MEKHEFVSAADKDLEPIFQKILELSVWGLMQQCVELGVVEELYSSDDIESMKEQIETIREDQFLEDIYGIQSKLSNAEWLKAMKEKGHYIFNTAELRKRVLAAASIEAKHLNAAPGQ